MFNFCIYTTISTKLPFSFSAAQDSIYWIDILICQTITLKYDKEIYEEL